jgi:hypothetical protein
MRGTQVLRARQLHAGGLYDDDLVDGGPGNDTCIGDPARYQHLTTYEHNRLNGQQAHAACAAMPGPVRTASHRWSMGP